MKIKLTDVPGMNSSALLLTFNFLANVMYFIFQRVINSVRSWTLAQWNIFRMYDDNLRKMFPIDRSRNAKFSRVRPMRTFITSKEVASYLNSIKIKRLIRG